MGLVLTNYGKTTRHMGGETSGVEDEDCSGPDNCVNSYEAQTCFDIERPGILQSTFSEYTRTNVFYVVIPTVDTRPHSNRRDFNI